MIVYIVVAVVIVLGLFAAYRSLGGSQAAEVDGVALIHRAARAMADAAAALESASGESTIAPGTTVDDGGRALRSQVEGAAQLVEQVDAGQLSSAGRDANALLRTAALELRWAVRLQATHPTPESAGMERAIGELLTHSRRCIQSAQKLLGESVAGAEEGHGAAQSLVE